MRPHIFLAFCALFLSFLSTTVSVSPTCYWPNGKATASGDHEATCGEQDAAAPCCWDGDACAKGGLCYSVGGQVFYRGGCTDKNWGPSCASYCLDSAANNGSKADLQINTDGTFCCTQGGAGCNTSASKVTQTVTSIVGSATGPVSSTASPIATSNCHTAAITAGVATPLGALFVASFALFVWQFRKNRAQNRSGRSVGDNSSSWNGYFSPKAPASDYQSVDHRPEQPYQPPEPKPELDGHERPHELSAR